MAIPARADVLDIPQDFIDRIALWFCQSFDDPYRNPRLEKSKGLYQLARLVNSGAIVELGSYHGNGAISLASGAPARLTYTIDDYSDRIDWMGNHSNRNDRAIMRQNIEESNLPIAWINRSVEEAARMWQWPIGLLYWDTGSNTLHEDFAAWSKHIVSGGMFVMHDTDDRHFHSDEIEREALALGWSMGPQMSMLFTVVKP